MTKLYDDPRLHQVAAWIADQLPDVYCQDDLDRFIDLADAQFDLGLSGAAAGALAHLVEQMRRTTSNHDHTCAVWFATVIRPGEDDLHNASLDRDAAIAWANLKISPSAKLVRTRNFGNAFVLTRLDDDRYLAIITCLSAAKD